MPMLLALERLLKVYPTLNSTLQILVSFTRNFDLKICILDTNPTNSPLSHIGQVIFYMMNLIGVFLTSQVVDHLIHQIGQQMF
jgi:hypothetical protein